MKVYLAGPISGRGYNEVIQFFGYRMEMLSKAGYEVLCPMVGKANLTNENSFKAYGYQYPVSTNHAIFERDKWMAQSADIVLVDLSLAKQVSIGTMFELAWTSFLGKHTIVVMQPGNIHEHCFVKEAADIIFENPNDAIDYLIELKKGEL
jgi:nucleoside 2-deoxyribosyltransferase